MNKIVKFLRGVFLFPFSVFMGGVVPGAPGMPDYSQDGSKNIPQLFSRAYKKKLYASCCVANITNTEHTGELKGLGGQVVINGIPDVYVGDYTRGKARQWQYAKADPIIMTVTRGSDFAVAMDDADKKQFWDKDFLGTLAKDAVQKQKIKIDREFFASVYVDAAAANKGATAGAQSAAYNLGATGSPVGVSKTNVLDLIAYCEGVGLEQNWNDEEMFMVLPSWMTTLMKVSDYKDASMTGEPSSYKGGKIGSHGKFELFNSNLYTPISDSGKSCYPVLFGTKSAVAFVSQLNDTHYFPQLETTTGSGIAGNTLYDWKTILPEQLGVFYCYRNQP